MLVGVTIIGLYALAATLAPFYDLSAEQDQIGSSKRSHSNDVRWMRKKARQAAFLEALMRHPTQAAACREIGIQPPTIGIWRRADPTFAAHVDAISLRRPGQAGRPPSRKKWTEQEPERLAAYRAYRQSLIDNPSRVPDVANWQGFAEFRKVFFSHESAWFHLRAVDALENSEPGTVTLLLFHPEAGKTTLLEDWLSYKFAVEPDFRVIVASEKQMHAVKMLNRIRKRMQVEHSPYVTLYGPFVPQTGEDARPQTWSATHFDVYKRHESDERDFSCSALGVGSAVAGSRCDLLILDDVQSLKSLGQTDRIVDEIRQDWLSRPGSKGRTVILGTRVGEDDVYEQLIDLGLVDNLVKFPAFDARKADWPAPDTRCLHPVKLEANLVDATKVAEAGAFLWPERYTPVEYLKMRLTAGEAAWARNYMQAPTASTERTFTVEMLTEASEPLIRFGHDTMGCKAAIIGWDPGYGTNALFVGGVRTDAFCALDWRRDLDLTSTDQMAQILEQLCHHWSRLGVVIHHLVVEDKAFQKGLPQDAGVKAVQRRFGFGISGYSTGGEKNDPDIGVAGMARSFRVGEIKLPGADDIDTIRARALLDGELLAWRPYRRGTKLRQDIVMAAWFSWKRWSTTRTRADELDSVPIVRTAGLGLTPTRMRMSSGSVRRAS